MHSGRVLRAEQSDQLSKSFPPTRPDHFYSDISSDVGEIRETKKTKRLTGANFYSDPVVGRVGANALEDSEFNGNKDVDGYPSNFCEPWKKLRTWSGI